MPNPPGGVAGGSAGPAPDRAVRQTSLNSLVQSFKDVYLGISNYFSPGEPIAPVQPESQPRARQIQVGSNLIYQPRATETTPFEQLRYFARNYDIASICIQRKIQQVVRLKWQIVSRDDKDGEKYVSQIAEVREFFRKPDKEHTWDVWWGMVLRDRLEIDAATIYPRPTRGGDLYALEPIDGSTIKAVADFRGKTPDYPAPAYEQILWGAPRSIYNRKELIYRPQNTRTDSLYGMSETELCLLIVNMALRKRVKDISHFTDGNVPAALLALPDTWSQTDIESYQQQFDAWLAGNLEVRSRMVFVPAAGRGGSLPIHEFAPFLGDAVFDTWLAKITAAAYYTSLVELNLIDDVNRSTADAQTDMVERDGIEPLVRYTKNVHDDIIADYLGYPELEWQVQEGDTDSALTKAQTEQIYYAMGAYQLDDIRENKLGLEPYGLEPFVIINNQPISIAQLKQMLAQPYKTPAEQAAEMQDATGDKPQGGDSGTRKDDTKTRGGEATSDTKADSDPTSDSAGADSTADHATMQAAFAAGAQSGADFAAGNASGGGDTEKSYSCCGDGGVLLARLSLCKSGTGSNYDGVDIDWHRTFTDGDKSPNVGEPLPGALDAIRAFQNAGLAIHFSCGGLSDPATRDERVASFRDCLLQNGIDPDHGIEFRAKPRTVAVVDDRAIPFGGNWNAIKNTVLSRFRAAHSQDVADVAAAEASRPPALSESPDEIKKAFREIRDDTRRWREVVCKALKSGQAPRAFKTEVIPLEVSRSITAQLDDLGGIAGPDRIEKAQRIFRVALDSLNAAEKAALGRLKDARDV